LKEQSQNREIRGGRTERKKNTSKGEKGESSLFDQVCLWTASWKGKEKGDPGTNFNVGVVLEGKTEFEAGGRNDKKTMSDCLTPLSRRGARVREKDSLKGKTTNRGE